MTSARGARGVVHRCPGPEDGYVSGTHARISYREGRFYLGDLGSSNGTFLRLRAERAVRPGTFLLMGQQLFKLMF